MNFSRLLAFVLSVVLATQAWATDVGRPVISNTTWTLAGSPYVVTNVIIVGGNATLTIQPGVTVKFTAEGERAGWSGSARPDARVRVGVWAEFGD